MGTKTESEGGVNAIDRSFRWPALMFLVSGVKWLMLALMLGLLTSLQEIAPTFLSGIEWLTYGRLQAAFSSSFLYGWGCNAAFAVGLWIMARLCGDVIRYPGLLFVSGTFWQIGVTVGVVGIFIGDMTSVPWLEMPTYATPLLLIAYAFIGVWGVFVFCYRKTAHVYVSQWYLLGALFWFPWLFSVAQIMIFHEPVRGTIQAITNWWYIQGTLGLWFTPVGLAAIYYLIPKVLGRPIHAYYLSVLAFWLIAFFSGWSGAFHLAGGPVPAWVVSLGIVASVLLLVPVMIITVNYGFTLLGSRSAALSSPTLRFIGFGALSFTFTAIIGALMSLRMVSEVTQFTLFRSGYFLNGFYAFFTMVMFGSIYFMMPRLLDRSWPWAKLIGAHFWANSAGIVVVLVALYVGGWIQGHQVNALSEAGESLYTMVEVSRNTLPWLYLKAIGLFVLAVGNLIFMVNMFWMVLTMFYSEACKVLAPVIGTPEAEPAGL